MAIFKQGAKWEEMHPEMDLALRKADHVSNEMLGRFTIVTSARDGRHMIGSKHYSGEAFDLRTRDVLRIYRDRLAEELGDDFDVVLESDHIHVEFDPDEE